MATDRQKKLYPDKGKGKGAEKETIHTRHARERDEAHGRHSKARDDHHKTAQKELVEMAERQRAEMDAEGGGAAQPTPAPAGPVIPAAGTAPAAQATPAPAVAA